jgi:hypothetical protein
LRVFRSAVAALIAGLSVTTAVFAVRLLEEGAQELRLRPSNGTWAGEEELGPEDIVPRGEADLASTR